MREIVIKSHHLGRCLYSKSVFQESIENSLLTSQDSTNNKGAGGGNSFFGLICILKTELNLSFDIYRFRH